MQYLIHDLEKVLSTPFLMINHHIVHDTINLIQYLLLQQLFQFHLSRRNYRPHNLHRIRIELTMPHRKVINQYLYQLQSLQYIHKRSIPIHNNSQQLQPKERHRILIRQYDTVVREKLLKDEFVNLLSRFIVDL